MYCILAPPYVTPVAPTSSSLARSVFSSSSRAFWEVLSLDESERTGDGKVMVTALEYP